jgi:hypothetical protein
LKLSKTLKIKMDDKTDFSKHLAECKLLVETEEDKNTGPKYRIRWRSQHTGFESGGGPMSFKSIEAVVGRFLTPGTIWCEGVNDYWIEKVPDPENVD